MAGPAWPIHPHPLPDELLSSWMIRIARGNGYKVQSFYASYFGRDRQIWNRDIDHHAPDWLIEALSERTTIRIERIRRMTLRAYEGTVFEEFQDRAVTRFVMSLSIYHRTHRAFGQQFCPICLNEDQQPYLRRCWRLALLTVCTKHQVVLQDRCGQCGKPVVPHRVDMSTRHSFPARIDMRTCGFCRRRIAAQPEVADGEDVLMQRSLEEVLESGYVSIGNNPNLYAHLYFNGLRAVMHGIRRLGVVTPSHHNFDCCDVVSRLALMREAAKLLQDWPDHFLRFCDHVRQPYTTFCRDGYLPYWLYSVMRANFWQAGASSPTLQSTMKRARSAVVRNSVLT
ncbi:TniQ family protein [Aquipseudomonas guryensis]|uniref:TniQ family protein n=1 Tax=Aquipseudomonas guryensis TaxID=2759165 RepID=A0A7W4H2A2_9GAMM|nr:TniQ family protein [Pseudomonas guryensis]